MEEHTEGSPSHHLTPADLDAAALVLVIPTEGDTSLWVGETTDRETVATALRAVADEVDHRPGGPD